MTFAEHAAQRQFKNDLANRHQQDGPVGNAEVDAQDVVELDDLYDSEVIAINKVMADLSHVIGRQMEGSALQREVRERFAEIGIVARCDLKKDLEDPRSWDDKPWIPSVSVVGRTEATKEFDHDRMGHEVRSNILGKNDQGDVQKKMVGQTGFESKTKSGIILPGSGS